MNELPDNYIQVINSLKEKIRLARQKVSLTVNKELLQIYWEIGSTVLQQQKKAGWGAKIIDRLAADLRIEFPDFGGLSIRNLKYMRAFAEAYPQFVQQAAAQIQISKNQPDIIVQQLAAQLPWGHHQVILDKIKVLEQKAFYIQKTIENGWSRNILIHQIETNLFERTGKAITNFKDTLPATQSDLAQQTIKNPYVFDFLSFSEAIKERELENALIQHLKKFMLELGKGFAYVGNQKNLVVDGDDFFLDLLFYNYHLHCFVVFELKIGDFKPEYAGKLNFYVNSINQQLKGSEDKPTIGVLLCKTPNETVIKYSLQGIDSPIGVAGYEFAKALPAELKGKMPTVEELEKEIDQSYQELKSPSQKRMDALKEKLAQLKGPEIKLTVTKEILFDIIDKSLMLLFENLLKRGKELTELFHSVDFFWEGPTFNILHLEDLPNAWKNEVFLKERYELSFRHHFNGLKKAGPNAFNEGYHLKFKIDTYSWGISLINHNTHQPLIKKTYGDQLTEEEINTILEITYNLVLKNIEWNLERIIEKKTP